MTTSLHIYDSAKETARALAELILNRAKEKHKKSLPFNIALSGGATPKLLFSILANEYADTMPWHFIRLFWVDERCVPPNHSESNFGMTYETLLKQLPVQDANIFRMQGESDPEKEAVRYQALLEKELPLQNGFPQFDLILLGMGDDGHTASIFPEDMSLLHSNLLVATNIHPLSGQKRITLTGSIIQHAHEVVFLITGETKSEVLRLIIQQESMWKNFPAAHMYSNTGVAEFYLDKAAASKL